MHTHFAQEKSHVVYEKFHALRVVTASGDLLFLLLGQRCLTLVPNVQNLFQVDAKEVEHGGSGYLVVDHL